MIKSPLVSIVIPNWNGAHLLEHSLSAIQKQTYKTIETIVVDNGSTDGSKDYLKKFSGVQVIALNKNYGFAPAVNKGILKAKGEFILLLNNDTKMDNRCVEYLVEVLKKKKDIGMVTAKMVNFYNPRLIDGVGDCIDSVGHATGIGIGQKDTGQFDVACEVPLVSGGGSLFRKEVFEKVGLLDEDYFAYFEDVDICLRAQYVGFKAWFEPKAIIAHVHKATSSKNLAFLEYLQFRNLTMTVIKDFPKELLLKDLNWLKIILVNVHTVYFLARQGYLPSALKAEVYVLTHLGELLEKRKIVQSSIRISEDNLLSLFRPKKIKLFGITL